MWKALGAPAWSGLRRTMVPNLMRAQYLSGSTPSPLPSESLLQRTNNAWNSLFESEWTDTPDLEQKVNDVDGIVNDYRRIYDPSVVASGAEAKELYDAVERLYVANEAAKSVELYAGYFESLMRKHLSMTGPLGNNTEVSSADADRAEKSLKEYFAFIESIKNRQIRRKVEGELGPSVLQLRQALSIEDFSAKFGPVACDRIIAPSDPSIRMSSLSSNDAASGTGK